MQKRYVVMAVAALAFVAAAGFVHAAADAVPVVVGEDPEINACPSLGVPKNPDADGTIAVYDGPFEGNVRVDSLAEGREFFICTMPADSDWWGIIYAPEDDVDMDCGVSAALDTQDYSGPCRSGWVAKDSIQMTAG
jgi:hypothetical protein